MIQPVFRIFDVRKAKEFYIDWLGFDLDWEYDPGHVPSVRQVSRGGDTIQLSEHHGDSCPGSTANIECTGLVQYHAELLGKDYKYNRPGIETEYDGSLRLEVIDPFGNRLRFRESHMSEREA